jgi:hypothetical protein
MTELEQARTYLKDTQDRLAYERGYHDKDRVRFFEGCTLAALSWVWDAQEREQEREMQHRREKIRAAFQDMIAG